MKTMPTKAEPCQPLYTFLRFAARWTPRAIVAGFAGYYSLGIAYDRGIMALIDRVAIHIFRQKLGYAALGAIMPTFQWYSAWGVRILSALAAGVAYDVSVRIAYTARDYFHKFFLNLNLDLDLNHSRKNF